MLKRPSRNGQRNRAPRLHSRHSWLKQTDSSRIVSYRSPRPMRILEMWLLGVVQLRFWILPKVSALTVVSASDVIDSSFYTMPKSASAVNPVHRYKYEHDVRYGYPRSDSIRTPRWYAPARTTNRYCIMRHRGFERVRFKFHRADGQSVVVR